MTKLLFALMATMALSACSRTVTHPSPTQPGGAVAPSITAIHPTSGTVNSIDTITGTNFNAVIADDSVYVNGIAAAVRQASATQMIITIPALATTGKLSVKVGDSVAIGPLFTVTTGSPDTIAPVTDSVMVSTFAGSGIAGYRDGSDTLASFSFLWSVAADQNGNVFAADANNHAIRKITPTGVVSTIPGTSNPAAVYGPPSPDFYLPEGVAVDQNDTLFISDIGTNYIFSDYNSVPMFLAGNGTKSISGVSQIATFTQPRGLAVDRNDNVYVADLINNAIKKITPDGYVSILAGGYGVQGGTNATGAAAGFLQPTGVAVDGNGNLFVADFGDGEIREITPAGVVTTLAGNLSGGASQDGTGSAATFAGPIALALDANGNIYVADYITNKIRKVTPAGVVTTIAGTGASGAKDGPGKTATFNEPTGIAVDGAGVIYVADGSNYKIRKIVIK